MTTFGMTAARAIRNASAGWRRAVVLGVAAAIVVALAPPEAGLAGFIAALAPALDAGARTVGWVLCSAVVVMLAVWLGPRLSPRDRRAIALGYAVGCGIYLAFGLAPSPPGQGPWRDAWNYFGLGLDNPYGRSYEAGGTGYLPPFFQLIAPLRAFGWPGFLAVWSAVELGALWLIAGPLAPAFLLVPLVAFEIWNANINLVLAAAIAGAFRWPAAWSLVLMTKVTPAVGLIWFVVRRRARPLAVALGATVLICLLSILVAPGMWRDWIAWVLAAAPPSHAIDAGPLAVRLPVAALIVVIGSRTGRAWLVPVAAVLALPVIWPTGLTILVACLPLAAWTPTRSMPGSMTSST